MARLRSLLPSAAASLDAILSRLLRAEGSEITGIVAELPDGGRAELAVFCYGRVHLHEIGLAIAATCDLALLIKAAPSDIAGQMIFAQSRERPPKPVESPANASRCRITLAKSAGNAGLASLIARIAEDESPELEPA